MLVNAFIGQTVRTTTRDAASLSNRLLPAEAGKNKLWNDNNRKLVLLTFLKAPGKKLSTLF